MIEIQDLSFAYDENRFRLEIELLSISAGERVAWIGPSSSGKTTLLHLIAGIHRPLEGIVACNGTDVASLDDAARRNFRAANMGLVFQDFALLDYLSVLDNILLPYRINRSLVLDEEVTARAMRLAEDVGLRDLLQDYPTHLSHGEQQRVAVCRALIAKPRIVLADEPTANLDADNASRVMNALDSHAKHIGGVLIVVSHDQELTDRLDRTIDISTFHEKREFVGGGSSFER